MIYLAAGIIERIVRSLGENEKVARPVGTFEDVFEERLEIAQVLRRIGKQQEFGQRKLSFAQNAESGAERLAGVAFAHHGSGQRMKTSLAVAPEIAYRGHYYRKKW